MTVLGWIILAVVLAYAALVSVLHVRAMKRIDLLNDECDDLSNAYDAELRRTNGMCLNREACLGHVNASHQLAVLDAAREVSS